MYIDCVYEPRLLHSCYHWYFVGGYFGNWCCELQRDYQIGARETYSRALPVWNCGRYSRTITFRHSEKCEMASSRRRLIFHTERVIAYETRAMTG